MLFVLKLDTEVHNRKSFIVYDYRTKRRPKQKDRVKELGLSPMQRSSR